MVDPEPQDVAVFSGSDATFTAGARGVAPFQTQWYKDNVLLEGKTGFSLVVPAATKADMGGYSLEVSNTYGSIRSASGYLNVLADPGPPVITAPPESVTQPAGSSVTFTVETLGGNAPPGTSPAGGINTYQWFHDDVAIPGATSASLTLPGIQLSDAGFYRVVVTNVSDTTTSRPARLTVADPVPGKLSNLSVRTVAGVGGAPLIAGFVVKGGEKSFLVRGAGPSLEPFGVTGFMQDPTIAMHANLGTGELSDLIVASNDNWADGDLSEFLSLTFQNLGAFAFQSTSSKDAAMVVAVDGPRTVHIWSASGNTSGVVLFETYDNGTGITPRLINVSARNYAGTGSQTLIAGFAIDGNVPRKILVRAIGPGLAPFGITTFVKDPRLELVWGHDGTNTLFATNDNWTEEVGAQGASVAAGAFPLPLNSKDAAIVMTLFPATYTAVLIAPEGDTGEALVEVYEVP